MRNYLKKHRYGVPVGNTGGLSPSEPLSDTVCNEWREDFHAILADSLTTFIEREEENARSALIVNELAIGL